ncbi:MAG: hypothetical protein V3T17_03050 [Pseudomonadales bacterium]
MTNTFDRMMKSPSFKNAFDEEYKELVISELICEMMAEKNSPSVRKLAKEVNLSTTAIQNLRSGIQEDVKLSNFLKIASACGFQVMLEKDSKTIPLSQ